MISETRVPTNPPSEWVRRIESQLDRLVDATSWIWLALMGLIGVTVLLRYALGAGRVDLEELEWHFYAIGFLTGIVACTRHDRHVRVDVFRDRMTPRTRAWVDLYGILLVQLPFIALILWSGLPFVRESFLTGEESRAAGGLPARFVLKTFLLVSVALLGLSSLAQLSRVSSILFEGGETDGGTGKGR